MENKFQTLQVIYEIVKNDNNPPMTNISPNEIISRLTFPWDEIVSHLHELKSDGYILMKQSLVAVISITYKGLEYMTNQQQVNIS